ncbi:MAG: hypothetical protein H6607_04395 [Flavobacteriales bacterium]|nr:hypothetical protein [Flavobacteriales bacterium]
MENEILDDFSSENSGLEKSKKIFIGAEIGSIILLIIGHSFKIMHWKFGNEMLMIGFLGLTALCLFVYPFFISKEFRNPFKLVLILGYITAGILILSFLFKRMKWTGLGYSSTGGLVLLALIAFLLIGIRNNKFTSNDFWTYGFRLLIVAIIDLLL